MPLVGPAAALCTRLLPDRPVPEEIGKPRYLDPAAQESPAVRSEEHTSELQSLMRISYAVFCLKKNTHIQNTNKHSNKETTHNTTHHINVNIEYQLLL